MTLFLHRAERTDLLADGLAELLREPPPDPFVADVVAVPTKGVERFLSQRLATVLGTRPGDTDGVCANVSFPSPDHIVTAVLSAAAQPSNADAWRPAQLRWAVLTQIQECLPEPWAAPLRRFLLDPDTAPEPAATRRGNGRIMALADRLAALFARYDRDRPAMIADWALGGDGDGCGAPVAVDLAWQPQLWRRVREQVGATSPAELLTQVAILMHERPHVVPLPARLSVFGPTRVPLLHLSVLRSLAQHRDVHLWLPDPSPVRWRRITADRAAGGAGGGTGIGTATGSVTAEGQHPLLRSLGRDSAELAQRLGAGSIGAVDSDPAGTAPVPHASLLGWLQHDIAADRVPDSETRRGRIVVRSDRSVQVHACHGRQRQVEVLREVLLGLLAADPTLQPRDILVMCPDLAGFAPLVTAAFGVGLTQRHTLARDLRVRIADRTPEQRNPVLATLESLLRLVSGRFSAAEVLDLAAAEPVSRRFGLDPEALSRAGELVAAAGVRWGLDAADRRRGGVPVDRQTWAAGLDRLLAGVALSDDDLREFGGVLPVDDVADTDVAAVGRLSELLDRLRLWAPRLREPQPPAGWRDTLVAAIGDLMAAPPFEQWQLSAALGTISAVIDPAEARACDVRLDLGDVRVLLADVLRGRPTRTNFRTGGVTVCSLVPMRSVPHRVVCLLGLDDGIFPRPPAPDGNDILAHRRQPGEHDRTSEDRQVLLDAVMAATENLVIVYSGFDQHVNKPLPAAVPTHELLDVLQLTATAAEAGSLPDQVVVEHPLQPFDPRNFTPDQLVPGRFSHDERACAGAVASVADRTPAPPLVPESLPAETPAEVALADLRRFLKDPPGYFLRERLGLVFRDREDPLDEQLPIALSGLAKWQVGQRVLQGLRDGTGDLGTLLRAESARGSLPVGALADPCATGIGATATEVNSRGAALAMGDCRDVPVAVTLPSGVRLSGVVGDVFGTRIVRTQFGVVRDHQKLDLWVCLLALAAADPAPPWSAAVVGCPDRTKFGRGRAGVGYQLLGLDAAALLDQLVQVFAAGRSDPLPLTPRSSAHYAWRRGAMAVPEALRQVKSDRWRTGSHDFESDMREQSITAVWGTTDPFAAMTAIPATPVERSWHPEEHTRFGALSRRVWDPLCESLTELR